MKFQPELERFLEGRAPYPKGSGLVSLLTAEEREILEKVKGEKCPTPC